MIIFTTIKEAMSFVNKSDKDLIIRKTEIFDTENHKLGYIDLKFKV